MLPNLERMRKMFKARIGQRHFSKKVFDWMSYFKSNGYRWKKSVSAIKGDLRTICRFSYMKVYKLITLGTKFKTLLSWGRKITMFSKFITNYMNKDDDIAASH